MYRSLLRFPRASDFARISHQTHIRQALGRHEKELTNLLFLMRTNAELGLTTTRIYYVFPPAIHGYLNELGYSVTTSLEENGYTEVSWSSLAILSEKAKGVQSSCYSDTHDGRGHLLIR